MLLDSLWVNTSLIRKFECEILMIFKKTLKNPKTLGFLGVGFLYAHPGFTGDSENDRAQIRISFFNV